MRNREFVMLAQPILSERNRSKIEPSNFLCSIKKDGMRCLWLPHTRGLPIQTFQWANRARDKRDHICSGLWSRYAKPIFCPDYFVERLPRNMVLDGELCCPLSLGENAFQKAMSAVKKLEPVEEEWGNVDYLIFDRPNLEAVFKEGFINNPNYIHKMFGPNELDSDYNLYKHLYDTTSMRFEATYYSLLNLFEGYKYHSPHIQVLPQQRLLSWKTIDEFFDSALAVGEEGIMMRRMTSIWEPHRSAHLLKMKACLDTEGIIMGWKFGEGKYEGMMGSLSIQMANGKKFDLSGFTDEERQLEHYDGGLVEACYGLKHFRIGHTITFKYQELTEDGLPRGARYYRKHMEI